MKPARLLLWITLVLIAWTGWLVGNSGMNQKNAHATTPSSIRIIREQNRYQITVNEKPYLIKGAGMGFTTSKDIATLAAAGGNTFRTWEPEHIEAQLNAAHEHGLMVLVGLDTEKELSGFDYNDTAAVTRQYKKMIRVIDRYKNHPSVLGWIIANEPNLVSDASGNLIPPSPKVYDALGQLVDYIHENDPHHPVTFSFAFTPHLKQDLSTALARVPTLDFVSLQAYGALSAVPDIVMQLELDKPFMVTEFGPLGHWEMPATNWGREIEEASAPKATGFIQRMQPVIVNDKTQRLIGSFAFLWGQKQERTPTWYGMFSESGEKTSIVDELTRLWTGSYPANRAPLTNDITLNDQTPYASVRLAAGSSAIARVTTTDPEGDPLTARWVLMEEVAERSEGGHLEAVPSTVLLETEETSHLRDVFSVTFRAPLEPGEYRLFAYIYDGRGGVGTANFPLLVQE